MATGYRPGTTRLAPYTIAGLLANMDAQQTQGKPVLYWDADCNFCRRWVDRWQADSAGSVEYRTLQSAPPDVVAAAGGVPFARIVLARTDGSLATGAGAALEALADGGRDGQWAAKLYRGFPPFRVAAEYFYAWVAGHRGLCGALTNAFWGQTTRRPTYQISGYLFPRLVGLVFLSAFVSLWAQIDGLTGSQGILPVADHLAAAQNHFASHGGTSARWLQMPSLLWFGASDTALHVWLGIGTVASALLVLGFLPATSAFVAWLCYLSFASAVPVFLNFQWDALLLETGLLVVFYVPWVRYLGFDSAAPSRIGRWLVWWLLFRLMFESGVVKLYGFDATGTNAWLDGTALGFHYFTQPIPVWTSWWIAQVPGWFHIVSLIGVFAIELVAPFLIAGPRRLRMTACLAFSALMILIMLSGHYGFFNWLTLALCVSLVDDSWWPQFLRRRLELSPNVPAAARWPERIHRVATPFFAVIIFVLTTLQLLLVLRVVSPATVMPLIGPTGAFRSANSYGLFSVMTTERPEITIEASADGRTWAPYRFRYKMDPNNTQMPFFMPHMPRLDWQLWFAALEYRSSGQPPGWVMPFLARLQERSPAVLGLLEPDGAAESSPQFFRLRLDLLTFSTPSERGRSGQTLQADPLPAYTIEGSLQR
jgi:predicted DCC family thiol-disulfide oxidoreductase YuxK